VTADNTARVYGQANPAFTASYSGFFNGDTAAVLRGSPDLTTLVTASSGVGTYTITAAQGTLSTANYVFTFGDGTLTVTPAILTVTADNASRVHGQANPAFTASYRGFVNGDNAVALGGTPDLSTNATSGSGVGTYTTTAAPGTLSAANYTFAFTDGTLTITPATLTVTANEAAKVTGQPNPVLTANITGYVNGDTAAAVRGSADLSTTATATSGPGAYTILAASGSLNADNYAFAFVNGTLTVRAAAGSSLIDGVRPPAVPQTLPTLVTPGISATSVGATQFLADIRQSGIGQTSLQAAGTNTGSGDTSQAGASSAAVARTAANVANPTGGASLLRAASVGLNDGASALPARSIAPQLNRRAAGDTPPVELDAFENSFIFSVRDPAPDREARFRPHGRLEVNVAEEYSPGIAAYEPLPVPYLVRRDLEWDPVAPEGADEAAAAGVLAASGLIATAGYVLLNPRTLAWMLSLLTSQPVWKQFDPLEVIFAWEEDQERDGTSEAADESLFAVGD
jgi:hypothetical protein